MWRRRLHKVADIVLELLAGLHPPWPKDMHKPLIIGLTLHFVSCPPWQLRNTGCLLDLGREVQRVWDLPHGDVRPLLRNFFGLPGLLETMPELVVQGLLPSTLDG